MKIRTQSANRAASGLARSLTPNPAPNPLPNLNLPPNRQRLCAGSESGGAEIKTIAAQIMHEPTNKRTVVRIVSSMLLTQRIAVKELIELG